jgi:4-hydroxyacetophenone monooxygenase
VCVIGTGCSALQFLPEIAPTIGHLTIFQRTPGWLYPTPDYHDTVPDGLQWLFRHVPTYSEWYRFFLFWQLGDGALEGAKADPAFAPYTDAVGQANAEGRDLILAYLEEQFGDRPDLLAKVTPHYPVASKRAIRDNGVWAATLKRANVELNTEKISEIVANGVVTSDGVLHECDVIIYGTGFTASRFLTPMRVVGRGGADLHQEWDGNARAYMGITVPRFPNMFLLYGPNTNIVVNGSIIFFSECEVRLVQGAIELLLRTGAKAMDVKPDVHDRYNERIDAGNAKMAWGVATVSTWYRNDKGHIAQNWPFSLLEFWQQTLKPDAADYELLGT